MQTTPPRSLWLDEALAAEREPTTAALEGTTRADVCIVGGGYAGLWTALKVKAAEPAVDVVILERDLCGSGASGRNAGYLMSWWSKYLSLEKLCGTTEALRIAQASDAAVDDILAFCRAHAIDADFRPDGWLWAAANDAQHGLWRETIDALGHHGHAPLVEWTGEQARARCGASDLVSGAYEAHVTRVQPALLARGLRRVALELGVRIFEQSPLTTLEHGTTVTLRTPRGKALASRVVITMNAWALRWAEIRRSVVAVSGDIIATPPIPERLAQLGWRDGLVVSDGRTLIQYYRTTRDGRLLYGKGGMSGGFSFGGRVGPEVEGRSELVAALEHEMHRSFPALRDVRVATSWRGPVDRSMSGLPHFWRLGGQPNVHYGVGFSGNGIGPCFLAGDILSALALERRTEWSDCPLVRAPTRDFPPEPFRYVGSHVLRHALLAKDSADDAGRTPSWATRLAMRFAPAGLSPFAAEAEAEAPPPLAAGGTNA